MNEVQNLYVVLGIARSGNHGVIDWLYDHLESEKCFFNNVNMISPVDKRELYYVNNDKHFNAENIKRYYQDKYLHSEDAENVFKKRLNEFTVDSDWIIEDSLNLPEDCNNLIISCENFKFNEEALKNLREVEDAFTKKIKRRTAVVLIRHPANLLASRLFLIEKRKSEHGPRTLDADVDLILKLWKDYASLAIDNRQLCGYDKTLYVVFEKWHSSKQYREDILRYLGIEKPEERRNPIGLYGGGSSFSGVTSSLEETTNLAVEDRWRQLLKGSDNLYIKVKQSFISILRHNADVLEISEEIYGKGSSFDIQQILKNFDSTQS